MGACVSKENESRAVVKPASTPPGFGLEGLYEPVKLLGKGSTGQTWLCKDVSSGEDVAVKLIKRPVPKQLVPMLIHEIKIQGSLGEGHLNIVSAKEVVLTRSHVALVMEFAAGGTMTAYVAARAGAAQGGDTTGLSEDEARYFMKQFLGAVSHCHNHQVAHRDLKLDNTLLDASDPPRIKICDFGFARDWDERCHMFTQLGTPVYMSPQIASPKGEGVGYDPCKADVWASGVLLFVMLLGMFPFEHHRHHGPHTSAARVDVWLQQIRGRWQEDERVRGGAARLSAECRDLLDRMFDLDESTRVDIEGIKQHPWWSLPLPPRLQEALQQLQQEQKEIHLAVESPSLKAADTSLAIQTLVLLSACPHQPNEPLSRVPLSTLTPATSPPPDPALIPHPILEDSTFHGAVTFSEGRTRYSDLCFLPCDGEDAPGAAPVGRSFAVQAVA